MSFTLYQPTTIHNALRQAIIHLGAHGIADARLGAEWILSHELGCARLELAFRHDDRILPELCRTFQDRINRLAAGEPLQYVLGEAEFMGRAFAVDRRCLIPRPETELLAEWIAGFAPLWSIGNPVLADAGTGSGCIVITLALIRPEGHYQAIDIDPEALALARDNAARHGVSDHIRFYPGHLLSALPPDSLDAVVSNAPYIRTDAWAQLPPMIRDYEPRLALDGGPDGLAVIRPLITQAACVLKPGGWLFLEIGENQWKTIRQLLAKHGFLEVQVRSDLAGKERIVTARQAGFR